MHGHSVSQGTVLDFKAGTQKYVIGYHIGTTAELTKTQLMKVLSPVLAQQAAPMAAAETETPTIAGEAMAADKLAAGHEAVTTIEAAAPSGTVWTPPPSQFVELKLASNPVGIRVLSTPDDASVTLAR